MEDHELTGQQILDQNGAANLLPVPAPPEDAGAGDTLDLWAEHYFRFEVTTSVRSQKEQQRDLALFLRFMEQAAGTLQRSAWTPRLAGLRRYPAAGTPADGARRFADRTVNRVPAHLKTFAKWIA